MSLNERELSQQEWEDLMWHEEGQHSGRGMSQEDFDRSRQSWRQRESERQSRHDGWLSWLDNH